jgi:hypothetical protein
MAYDFSGVNQSLGNDGGLSGIDVAAVTIAVTLSADTWAATSTPFNTTSAFAAGGSQTAINLIAPVAAGAFAIRVFYNWTTTDGTWRTGDFALGQLLRIVVTYNRAATTNDPRMWVNGTEQTLVELTTPVGTAQTGTDGMRAGENAAGGAGL